MTSADVPSGAKNGWTRPGRRPSADGSGKMNDVHIGRVGRDEVVFAVVLPTLTAADSAGQHPRDVPRAPRSPLLGCQLVQVET